jgi:hypothetical protein
MTKAGIKNRRRDATANRASVSQSARRWDRLEIGVGIWFMNTGSMNIQLGFWFGYRTGRLWD